MNAFNPIATMQKLEASGFERRQAETLADALNDVRSELVTKADLEAALSAFSLRICAALCAAMALGFAALGLLISLHK